MKQLFTFAINDPIIKVVFLIVKDGNERAIYLYKKYGFEVVCAYQNNIYVNNQYRDGLMNLY